MEPLTPEQKSELKTDLEALRRQLEQTLAASKAASRPTEVDQGQVGRLSRMDAIQQQKMVEANRRRQEASLRLAMSALNLDNDLFGLCRRCEEPIGYPRLKARPETPLCLECKGETERR